ncbi:hypothetical protein ABT187_00790 [Streptomyces sp. NPDC001817]|uniref:hypothetical protein n=1 Tax=Streptomyces sp. NPDC001817 TaxID=3154398 RepID=UPI00332D42C7
MTVADYLIDTSALAHVLLGRTTAEEDDMIGAGLVPLCDHGFETIARTTGQPVRTIDLQD